MNKNILNLYEKIIIDERSFERLRSYARSRNVNPPESVPLNNNIFDAYTRYNEQLSNDLESTWMGLSGPALTNPEIKDRFLKNVEKMFVSRDEDPIFSYIFKYHTFVDNSEKSKAIDSLATLLATIKKAYDFINEPEDKRYFDENYNFNFTNLTMGQVTRIEQRIKEVEEMSLAATLTESEYAVYKILQKYNLVP